MSLRFTEQEYAAYLRKGQPAPVSEKAWQDGVMRLLAAHGFMAYHAFDSRRSPHGWPDVAAIKPTGGILYLCELKTDTGQVTPAQAAWLEALGASTGVVAEVWRPSMLEDVVKRLRGI
jgi:hypothetical protein